MNNNPVHWFELPAVDLQRAQTFYETVFGFQMTAKNHMDYEMVWFPGTGGQAGASGALMKGMGYEPSLAGSIIYFTTMNIDESVSAVERAGGKIHVPKKDIGEYGYIAIFEDSEGNRVGLHQMRA